MAANGPRGLKYNADSSQKIIEAIELGAARTHAAAYGGITLDTLNNWEKKYPAFAASMLVAKGVAAVGKLRKITKAADEGDWRAAAWTLEHAFADEYNRQISEQRHSGSLTLADLYNQATSPDNSGQGDE